MWHYPMCRHYPMCCFPILILSSLHLVIFRREKLIRERGAGSRDFISKFFGILTTMARQTYYRGL
jgi:hypothetical protein